MGALSAWERNETLAQWLVNTTLHSMQSSTQMYGPDGAWWEGAVYWGYTTWNTVLVLKSLNASFGDTMGFLSNAPGYAGTSDFMMHSFSEASVPNRVGYGWNGAGAMYNWADANASNLE